MPPFLAKKLLAFVEFGEASLAIAEGDVVGLADVAVAVGSALTTLTFRLLAVQTVVQIERDDVDELEAADGTDEVGESGGELGVERLFEQPAFGERAVADVQAVLVVGARQHFGLLVATGLEIA